MPLHPCGATRSETYEHDETVRTRHAVLPRGLTPLRLWATQALKAAMAAAALYLVIKLFRRSRDGSVGGKGAVDLADAAGVLWENLVTNDVCASVRTSLAVDHATHAHTDHVRVFVGAGVRALCMNYDHHCEYDVMCVCTCVRACVCVCVRVCVCICIYTHTQTGTRALSHSLSLSLSLSLSQGGRMGVLGGGRSGSLVNARLYPRCHGTVSKVTCHMCVGRV